MSDLPEKLRVVADVQDEIGSPGAAFTCRQAADALEAALLRLGASERLLSDIKKDLEFRANVHGSDSVELGATLWNRLCEHLDRRSVWQTIADGDLPSPVVERQEPNPDYVPQIGPGRIPQT